MHDIQWIRVAVYKESKRESVWCNKFDVIIQIKIYTVHYALGKQV